jgi:hypothetical protein
MIVTKDITFNEKGGMESQIRRLDANLTKLFQAMQGRVSFSDNVAGKFFAVADTGAANTEFSVTHSFGAVPTDFILTSSDKATEIYKSGTAWTSTIAYFKSSTANCVIRLYIIKI